MNTHRFTHKLLTNATLCSAGLCCAIHNTAKAELLSFNANNCEFFIDGVASIYSYNMAWSRRVLHSEIVAQDPTISRFGQWIRYRDTATGQEKITEIFASQNSNFIFLSPTKWAIDFEYAGTSASHPGPGGAASFAYDIIDFAYFAESQNSVGTPIRLWISNQGQNFSFDETFSQPTYTAGLGRGSLTWSDQSKKVFSQKRACN